MIAVGLIFLGLVWSVFLPKTWIKLAKQISSGETSYWLFHIPRNISLGENPAEFFAVNFMFSALMIFHTLIPIVLIYIGISNIR